MFLINLKKNKKDGFPVLFPQIPGRRYRYRTPSFPNLREISQYSRPLFPKSETRNPAALCLSPGCKDSRHLPLAASYCGVKEKTEMELGTQSCSVETREKINRKGGRLFLGHGTTLQVDSRTPGPRWQHPPVEMGFPPREPHADASLTHAGSALEWNEGSVHITFTLPNTAPTKAQISLAQWSHMLTSYRSHLIPLSNERWPLPCFLL